MYPDAHKNVLHRVHIGYPVIEIRKRKRLFSSPSPPGNAVAVSASMNGYHSGSAAKKDNTCVVEVKTPHNTTKGDSKSKVLNDLAAYNWYSTCSRRG